MTEGVAGRPRDLPPDVARVLDDFVTRAREAFGPDLDAIVLYGSAAEGALRATSDVNVIIVLAAFDRARADRLRDALVVAHAAVRLSAMFLLREELPRPARPSRRNSPTCFGAGGCSTAPTHSPAWPSRGRRWSRGSPRCS